MKSILWKQQELAFEYEILQGLINSLPVFLCMLTTLQLSDGSILIPLKNLDEKLSWLIFLFMEIHKSFKQSTSSLFFLFNFQYVIPYFIT